MHSPEQNRKKAEAREEALRHHQHAAVDGMKEKGTPKMSYEAEEKAEHGTKMEYA